jgi:exopolysaccharide biosynthesis polyprenyl glycosylphosphotransferase
MRVQPTLHAGEWFWSLAFLWILVTIIGVALNSKYGGARRSAGPLVGEAVFLLLLSIFALTGGPEQILLLFFLGSLLYLPIKYGVARIIDKLTCISLRIQATPKVLVVGSKERARDAIRGLANSARSYEVIGCLDPDESSIGTLVAGKEVLGSTASLPEYLFKHALDLVIFAMPLELVPDAKYLIDAANTVGIPIGVVLDSGLQRLGHSINGGTGWDEKLGTHQVVTLTDLPTCQAYLILKRFIDILVSAVLLVLLSPVLFVIALLVKLTSPNGTVLYQWNVLGHHRRPFVGYKFRTMVPEAEALKSELLHKNEMTGPVFKMRDDPRVTPLGKFLRKYSLDELPQLFSVLKGDMSLVGPRPPSRDEADQFKFWQRRKLSVKPGITCLWQVNGRNEISSFDEWALLDLEYIAKASLWFDFKILLQTIPAVLFGRGAH